MKHASWHLDLSTSTNNILREVRARVDAVLEEELTNFTTDLPDFRESGLYTVHGGGKRVRPALVLLSAYSCRGRPLLSYDSLLLSAGAVELVHTYSLIHDDLPCMDDDELRRGRPACHIAFDVPTACWTGDVLQVAAFELLFKAFEGTTRGSTALKILERSAGFSGMVGGQWLDLEWEETEPTRSKIQKIHELKTAALISGCCEIGALAGNGSPDERRLLRRYGALVGMAFQATDDLIDLVGESAAAGKKTGKDLAAGKLSLAAILDEREIRSYASDLLKELNGIHTQLRGIGSDALHRLAGYIIHRTS